MARERLYRMTEIQRNMLVVALMDEYRKQKKPGACRTAHRPARRQGGRCAAAQKPFAVGQGKTV